MTYKDILLHLDLYRATYHRIETAVAVARRFGASLTGLFVKPPSIAMDDAASDFLRFIDDGDFTTINEATEAQLGRAAVDLEAEFNRQLRASGVDGAYRAVTGSLREEVIAQARCADFVIVAQSDPEGTWALNRVEFIGEVLVSIGRPVLVVPCKGRFPEVGERILVAWNESREAARAVNDAFPFLQRAKLVNVVTVDSEPGRKEGTAGHAFIHHLARHDVSVELHVAVAGDKPIGDLLLAQADAISADLIVAGGYGHSRLRQWMFGGVTRRLLTLTSVPLFISH